MREQWLPVINYEGIYEVSTLGNVKAVERFVNCRGGGLRPCPEHLLATQLVAKPRCRLIVHLWKNNKRKAKAVGRLVLAAFVGPCPEGMECCHFPDPNPANCQLDNVRWDTKKANAFDRRLHGTQPVGTHHWRSTLTDDLVREIKRRKQAGQLLREIAAALPVAVGISTVQDVLKGRTWTHVCCD